MRKVFCRNNSRNAQTRFAEVVNHHIANLNQMFKMNVFFGMVRLMRLLMAVSTCPAMHDHTGRMINNMRRRRQTVRDRHDRDKQHQGAKHQNPDMAEPRKHRAVICLCRRHRYDCSVLVKRYRPLGAKFKSERGPAKPCAGIQAVIGLAPPPRTCSRDCWVAPRLTLRHLPILSLGSRSRITGTMRVGDTRLTGPWITTSKGTDTGRNQPWPDVQV